MNPKLLTTLAVLGCIIAVIYFGPVSSYYAWEDLHPVAYEETENIVQYGLAAQVSQDSGPFNPAAKHAPPSINTLRFFVDFVAFGIPEEVEFRGTSTQGAFTGTYNTETGQVICDADIGGMIVPGLDMAKPGHKKVKITGTFKDNKLDVKIDGRPAVIVDRPARGFDDEDEE